MATRRTKGDEHRGYDCQTWIVKVNHKPGEFVLEYPANLDLQAHKPTETRWCTSGKGSWAKWMPNSPGGWRTTFQRQE